ncbi:MAG: G5 domain-containing protein [Oscillospiraceae bacterium]|nr:G5 domain-containing protein [Oscillospiraceae bacterium]
MKDIVSLTVNETDAAAARKRKIRNLSAAAGIFAVLCITAAAAAVNTSEPDIDTYVTETAVTEEVTETTAETEAVTEAAEEAVAEAMTETVPEIKEAYVEPVKAYTAWVTADGVTVSLQLEEGTAVSEALEQAGIVYDDNDIINYELDTEINCDIDISVSRVDYVKQTKRQTLAFETEYCEDDNLPVGETALMVEGQKGEAIVETLIKKVDGEAVGSKILSREITAEPVNELIANGTMEEIEYPEEENVNEEQYAEAVAVNVLADNTDDAMEDIPEGEFYPEEEDIADESEADEEYAVEAASEESEEAEISVENYTHASEVSSVSMFEVPEDLYLDENGVPVNYTQVLSGKSCAYTAEEGALMSTGKTVDQGYVAVNPDIIPYGSKLYIVADDGEVYGYAIAADTGGSVRKNHIIVDLFMWSYDDCIQWGAKNVTIYVLPE